MWRRFFSPQSLRLAMRKGRISVKRVPRKNARDPGYYAMSTTSFPSTLPPSINS